MKIEHKALAAHGSRCPECGERTGIEWNGFRGRNSSYGCHGNNGCGCQWDAADYELDDDELQDVLGA